MSEIQLSARALESKLGEWRTGGSAYRGLADRIRLLALDGRLTAGTRLPAERELGLRLGLSRTTVTAAYREPAFRRAALERARLWQRGAAAGLRRRLQRGGRPGLRERVG
ncbi:GntR family transcriptional regulator [Cryobacterium breve]|uniref:GntR family transcriptional regulator n=1 Tax=Cryobacterium breve TaxID=1259258 RepID=A0ABY7N9P8_9MICO|nr:GntR family transcriptional regulator [Cryobacterium breve]WBM79232.1 GntR family transcriptional regulator [Cryobacterium breve]